MTRLSRTAAALSLALAVTAGLAGCSEERLGSAAVIDGTSISTDELQQATQGYLKVVPGADAGEAQRRILERMILSRVIDEAARKQGVHASAGAVAKQRDDVLASTGGRKGLVEQLANQQQPVVLAPSYIDRWFKDRVLYTRLARSYADGGDPTSGENLTRTSAALLAAGRSMDIEVNPRYGTWNPRRGVSPLVSGGLSQTAAQLNAGG